MSPGACNVLLHWRLGEIDEQTRITVFDKVVEKYSVDVIK